MQTPGGTPSAGRAHRHKSTNRLSLLLFVGLVVAVLTTHDDYGVNSDEVAHFAHGPNLLRYYSRLIHPEEGDFREYFDADNYEHGLYRYPGLFDITSAVVSSVSPLGPVRTTHLLNALVGIFGIAGCWMLGRLLGGPRAGLAAAGLLALVPAYYGHMFNNPKDIPFAAAYVWALYLIGLVGTTDQRVGTKLVLQTGLAIGAAVAIRAAGLLLLVYLSLAVLRSVIRRPPSAHPGSPSVGSESIRDGIRILSITTVLAFAVMLAFWPWAQAAPLHRAWTALHFASYPMTFLFDGEIIDSRQLPRLYLPWILLVRLPELLLVSLAAVPLAALTRQAGGRSATVAPGHVWLLIALSGVLPVAYAVLARSPLYNGCRHFLFVIPPLCALAGAAVIHLLHQIRRHSRVWFNVVALGSALAVAHQVAVMVSLHPYQYAYYNRLVGGVEGAVGRYELDYYCHSYAEAIRRLTAQLRLRDGYLFSRNTYAVYTADHPFSSDPFFPPNFRRALRPDEADFIVDKDANRPEPILFTVERRGVPLNYVRIGSR